jgi:hypothetical protein
MLTENPVYVWPELVGSYPIEVIDEPADIPSELNSAAVIKYCVFAPPHEPGRKEDPDVDEVDAPAPRAEEVEVPVYSAET